MDAWKVNVSSKAVSVELFLSDASVVDVGAVAQMKGSRVHDSSEV